MDKALQAFEAEIKRSPEIYERISLVMDDVQAVGKGTKNNQQGWWFRSIDQIKNATNPAFRKHRVFYTPEILEETTTEQITTKGAKMTHYKIKVRYRLHTIDGSSVDAIVMGEAADSGDKGLGKAQTYAEKTMLIQVLNLPTEEQSKEDEGLGGDPDRDSHEFKTEPEFSNQNEISILDLKKKKAGYGLLKERTYEDCTYEELCDQIIWIRNNKKEGTANAKRFIEEAELILSEKPEPPPPTDDDIPF